MNHIKHYENFSLDLNITEQIYLLDYALKYEKVELVKKILFNGEVDPNISISDSGRLSYNYTPILMREIIKKNPNLDIIQTILDAGANVNLWLGDRPLIIAVLIHLGTNFNKSIFLKIFEKLLEKGLNLLSEDSYGSNFFDHFEDSPKKFSKDFVEKVKSKASDQYEQYLLDKEMKKFNL